jgi:hypothetical protein
MKKQITVIPGDIIRLPLPEGLHTYARILIDDSYAFYDAKTKAEISNLEEIISKPILFMANVNVFALKEAGWKIIGNIPLEGSLKKFYPRYFTPAHTNSANIGFYEVYKDEIEQAIKNEWIGAGKLQMGGTHSSVNIEERIMDYYNGRRNIDNNNCIWIFKKHAGLPLNESERPDWDKGK